MSNELAKPTDMSMSAAFAASGLFTDLKSEAQAIVKIQAGAELGIGPFAAMQGINVLMGKLNMASSLQATLIKRSGRYNFRVREHDEKHCKIEFFEKWEGKWESCGFSEFSIDDAVKAGLPSKNSNWTKVPRNMVFARAISNGAKWFCSDVFGGPVYNEADDIPVYEHVEVDNSGIDALRAAIAPIKIEKTLSTPSAKREVSEANEPYITTDVIDVTSVPVEDTSNEITNDSAHTGISLEDIRSSFAACKTLVELKDSKDAVKRYIGELDPLEQQCVVQLFQDRQKEIKNGNN